MVNEEGFPPPIIWQQGRDGVVTLMLDDPQSSVNTVSVAFIEALRASVDRLEAEIETVTGVIVRSAKASFMAGGDLNRLMAVDPETVDVFIDDIDMRKTLTRRLELLPVPVVAIINGSALGGGLELALACHHSIAIAEGSPVAGLPESTLGLIPGAGGIVRTVDRLGIDRALDRIVIPGTRFSLREASELGLIDHVVDSEEEAEAAAAQWMQEHRDAPARIVNRPPSSPRPLPSATAVPVARAITAVANAVLEKGFEKALHAESVAMGSIVSRRGTKNSIRVNFFETGALRKRARALSPEPDPQVVLVPLATDRTELVSQLERRRITIAEAGFTGSVREHADAYIALDGVLPENSPLIWIAGDAVGDGQAVIEYSSDQSPEANAAIAGLARAGVLPVPVHPSAGPLGRLFPEAFASAVQRRLDRGALPEQLAGALSWAGLTGPAEALGVEVEPLVTEVDLACEILSEVAETCVAAMGPGVAELDDALSVRAGGFPSWTGGVRAWTAGGVELAHELAESDVAKRIEGV